MPFWWNRRRKPWWGRWRRYKRKTTYKRRKRRRLPRRRNRRFTRRHRYRKRKKVRRKLAKLPLYQWQPETIHKCKIKGFTCNVNGANGTQYTCYTDSRFDWVPPKAPGGGGFGYEKYTLQYLFKEHQLHRNIWTSSNLLLELARYTGAKIDFYRHPHVDFIAAYSLSYPMQADIESYMTCHPAILMNARHKKVIPSLLTRPHGKNRVRIKLKPPKLMVNKWFFQQHIAETGLVTIKTAACNLRYSFLGCCNSNQLVAFYALNNIYYQSAGWGNNKGGTQWYRPYPHAQAITNLQVTLYNGQVKNITVDTTNYEKTISYSSGYFQPYLLQTVKWDYQIAYPVTAGRYNPTIDTGDGNMIWVKSVLALDFDPPQQDFQTVLQDRPLWLMLYGFISWLKKKKGDPGFLQNNYLMIRSPFIFPKRGGPPDWIPIDKTFYLGQAPFNEYLTDTAKTRWYPTLEHQQESINAIVQAGPFIPKLDNQTYDTWELHSKYTFYFKWGGSQLPDQDTADPSRQQQYVVPDKLQQAIQITDPQRQTKESILHSWDFRRGLITKRALKRMYENLSADETVPSDTEDPPQKKSRGNAMPVTENQEEKIQNCLRSLFEESTCQEQEENQDLLQLIKQQQQQQELIKLNLLQLIADLKAKQQVIQLQTGILN
nr:MAG: ORF1 [Torque teno midi virus]UHK03705.1 MAG: ORF1 [Torque teno midi virus]UHM26057.1 MAG: ORF1 [Torque teno midi virus]